MNKLGCRENLRKEGATSGENNLKAVVAGSQASLGACTHQAVGREIEASKDNR